LLQRQYRHWSALTVESGKYLGQVHTIISTTRLSRRSRPDHSAAQLRTLVAYPGHVELEGQLFEPLPEAEAEAEFVAKLIPETWYLRGTDADADTMLRELPNFSVFYFSGHAAQRAYGGELVVQSPHGGEMISASRLERLRLPHTKLVVLSACSTAVESGSSPINPNGLVGAFLNAGAAEVVASLWSVDSSKTDTLMTNFYRRFLAQLDAGTALRAAQEDLRQRTPDLHPYFGISPDDEMSLGELMPPGSMVDVGSCIQLLRRTSVQAGVKLSRQSSNPEVIAVFGPTETA